MPLRRTSFIGRERECLEVKRHLAMTRLLTLTGTGGCGKTRLGLEVARDLVGVYPDGVWLIELAPLSEEELVPKAVAQALEVAERPEQPLAETLAEILRGRELLLILDNCEHLLEATARLVDLLLDSSIRILQTVSLSTWVNSLRSMHQTLVWCIMQGVDRLEKRQWATRRSTLQCGRRKRRTWPWSVASWKRWPMLT